MKRIGWCELATIKFEYPKMRRSASIILLSFAMVGTAGACTCVSAVTDTPMSQASVVFRGTPLESKLLPQHPKMKGRRRYAVTFRVDRYWKGTRTKTITSYDLGEGTDCHGFHYQVGKEYLVYAFQEKARDYRFGDFFWFGWTDVLPVGTLMLQPMTCTPGGDTSSQPVRIALRELGPGQSPLQLKTKD